MDPGIDMDTCVGLLEGEFVLRGGYLTTPALRVVQGRLALPGRTFVQFNKRCYALRGYLFPPGQNGHDCFDNVQIRISEARDKALEDALEVLRAGRASAGAPPNGVRDLTADLGLDSDEDDSTVQGGAHVDTSKVSPCKRTLRRHHGVDRQSLLRQVAPMLVLTLPVYGKAWVFNVLANRAGRPQGGGKGVLPWLEVTPGNMLQLKRICAEAMGLPESSVGKAPQGSPRRRRLMRRSSDPIRSGKSRRSVTPQPAALLDPTGPVEDTAMRSTSSATQRTFDEGTMDASCSMPGLELESDDGEIA